MSALAARIQGELNGARKAQDKERVLLLGTVLSANLESIVHGLERLADTQFLDASVYLMSDLPAQVEVGDVALIALTAFALCCLSTLYPAWRAARTDPAKALRHE